MIILVMSWNTSTSAHVQLDDVPRTLDPVEARRRVLSARRRGNGVDDDLLARVLQMIVYPTLNSLSQIFGYGGKMI